MTDQIRVLFVDDNAEFIDLAKSYLEQQTESISLVGETDVTEAIDRLTAAEGAPNFDVIISDYQMPEMDGLEFLDVVRETHPGLPFVLMTGRGNEELASTAIHRGVSDYLPKSTGTDQFRVLANRIENLVGHTRAESSLQAREAHLEALTAAFPDLAFLIDEDGRLLEYFAGAQAEALLRADPSDFLDHQLDEVLPDPVSSLLQETIQRTLQTRQLQTIEYQLEVPAGERWFEARISPVDDQTGPRERVVLVARDVTQRKRRELVIEQLHEATRDLMHATTKAEVADSAVTAASEILDFTGSAVFLFDDATSALRPAAFDPVVEELLGGHPTFEAGDSIAWEVFVSGEPIYVPDVRDHEQVYNPETPIRSEVIVPLGDHGVLIGGSTSVDAFSETDLDLVHILASNIEAALDRTEREEDLLERERTLTERNEELQIANHLNSIFRDIGRTITSASTRDDIQQTVCDRLTDTDQYTGAWVTEVDTTAGALEPAAWAGFEADYFDQADGPTAEGSPEQDLCAAAIEHRSVQLARNVLDAPEWGHRRRDAFANEYRSVGAIPIHVDESVFSVLVLYARQPDAFGDRETAVLAEVGSMVGHTIQELEKVRGLVSDTVLELEIGIRDTRWFPCRLSAQLDCRLEVEGFIPRADGSALVFVTATGESPNRMSEIAQDWTSILDATVIASDEAETLAELEIVVPELVDILHTIGATIQSVTAEDGGSTVTVGLPPGTDVRSLLESIEASYSGTELLARRERTDTLRSRGTLKAELIERLTERQFEVLQAAYFGGFFDSSRKATGEQLSELLDISGPTFHNHLRAAQRKLLAATLER